MLGDFFKNRRAQRLGVYSGTMNKCDKNGISNIAQRKAEKQNRNLANLHRTKKGCFKTLGPNGMIITMVS